MLSSCKNNLSISQLDLKVRKAKVQIHKWWNNYHYNGNPNDNILILTSRPKNIPFISLRNDEYGDVIENMKYITSENISFSGRKYNSNKGKHYQPPTFKAKNKKIVARYPNNIKKAQKQRFRVNKKLTSSVITTNDPIINYENFNRVPIYHDLSIKKNTVPKSKLQIVNNLQFFNDDYNSLYELEMDLIEDANDSVIDLKKTKMPFGNPKSKPSRIVTPQFENYVCDIPLHQMPIPEHEFSTKGRIFRDQSLKNLTDKKINFTNLIENDIPYDNSHEDKENRVNERRINSKFSKTRYEGLVDNNIHVAPNSTLRTLFRDTKLKSDSSPQNSRNGNFKALPKLNSNFEVPIVEKKNTTKQEQQMKLANMRRKKRLKLKIKSFFSRFRIKNSRNHDRLTIRFNGIFKWFPSFYSQKSQHITNIVDSKVINDPNLRNKVINILSLNGAKITNNEDVNDFIIISDSNSEVTHLNNYNSLILLKNNKRIRVYENVLSLRDIKNYHEVSYLSNRTKNFNSYRGSIYPYEEYEDTDSYPYAIIDDYEKLELANER